MAGAGYKLFQTGDVLTAAQVNTYLNEQTVMVFANAAARTSALTSVLAEGMMSYLQDTNSVEVYNGSAWVAVGGASPLTTKGDLYTYSTSDTRLGVGANGTVLTADSAEATGLKWAAAAGGGMTVIASGTLSSTAVDITSIPQTYKHLQLVMWNTTMSANDGWSIQYNAVTSNYIRSSYGQNGATSVNGSVINDNGFYYGNGAADPLYTSAHNHWILDIYDYTNTTGAISARGSGVYLNTSSAYSTYQASYSNTATAAAITSLKIKSGASKTIAGSYILYGVK